MDTDFRSSFAHRPWPWIAALSLAGVSCGGIAERDDDFASFLEIRKDSTSERFQFSDSEVRCWRHDAYPNVLLARFRREQSESDLSIRLAPFGQAHEYFAAGESTMSELEPPLECAGPCARFNWQHGDHSAVSFQESPSCFVAAELESRAVRASFECVDMLAGPNGTTSLVDGTFGCNL